MSISLMPNSIGINETKEFPLKNMTRSGVQTATPAAAIKNGILDIKVFGARPGKYYRLEYYSHNYSTYGYQMLFSEYDELTYSTAAVATTAIALGDIPAPSIESGTIITRTFNSTRIAGLKFVVTYQPESFTSGGQYLLNSPGSGYSSIIDPANYFTVSTSPIDSSRLPTIPVALLPSAMGINEAKEFPLKNMTRSGVQTATPAAAVKNGILDIKVFGARAGKYYRLEYYSHNYGAYGYQMLFSEYDAATYASAAVATVAVGLGDIPAASIESGAVITRTFVSTRIAGLSFVVTYQPGAFTSGVQYVLNSSGQAGFSSIIDPAQYFPGLTLPDTAGQIAYSVTGSTDRQVSVAFRLSDTNDMRLTLKKYGLNNLYNLGTVDVAAHGGTKPSLTRAWAQICDGSSDWLGPYRVYATSDSDGGAEAFTGGAHGSNGDQTGNATARNLSVEIAVDGVVLGSGLDYSGFCRQVTMTWTNRVQGFNTKTTAREILEETFTVQITARSVEIHGSIKALEGIVIRRYYGLQSMANGFSDSAHMVGGVQGGRVATSFGTDYQSGAYSGYPSIPVIAMRSANGEFWMWLDENYGLGASRVMDSANSAALFSQYRKAYHTLVYSYSGLAMSSGQIKKWRGGYAWGQNRLISGTGDSALRYFDGQTTNYVAIATGAGDMSINIDPQDRNKPATAVIGTCDSYTTEATTMTASGYGITKLRT